MKKPNPKPIRDPLAALIWLLDILTPDKPAEPQADELRDSATEPEAGAEFDVEAAVPETRIGSDGKRANDQKPGASAPLPPCGDAPG